MKPINCKWNQVVHRVEGKVGVPILMYLFGVPGGICLVVWLFFFRGK